ncbi:ATP-dependent DNA helicase RecG [Catalinimonas alkaloidigena]|uniref:ATP-dependent DNA helicase RecG n=1 Tax=Catalinimonas alkaloidigena TaxID=1075417 RepID=A0A1G9EU46_9BACT|nr:ATP-dependent DNA helicase RecG [Catalinimonas alkaloidigena]SDK79558.1 ATP-dependent DNA helicase RecG [Catalinimonas alkaloidigena]
MHPGFFNTKLEYLRGVGPQKAATLNKELELFTYGDLIQHYPFRYEDRSRFYDIGDLTDDLPYVQVKGHLVYKELIGEGPKKRLMARLRDQTGELELVWFQGIKWVQSRLKLQHEYVVFGKASSFQGKFSIAHPELELLAEAQPTAGFLQPVYHTTETMKRRFLDSRALGRIMRTLIELAKDKIPETLPHHLIDKYRLMSKAEAMMNIHFPEREDLLQRARFRLKYEELFYVQLRLLRQHSVQKETFRGYICSNVELITRFYNDHLPFDLTNAQKRVIREIFQDFKSGRQMNRLLQGDVGSGKTIVAFICMLLVIGSGYQACMMAPTEILADQHYTSLKEFAEALGIGIGKLTGSTTKRERAYLDEMLQNGQIQILVGTHALLEDWIEFPKLGLCVIDEQHRFGVAQRARLWGKNPEMPPHVLVMTATPIPRTLAMTVYGDLDVSVIDELPPGRKPIRTVHRFDKHRLRVFGFLKNEIEKGRQAYIVYPLIEESETLDYKDLMDGYESVSRYFPDYPLSIVHGKMKAREKDYEMARFVKGETKIMVATTVIEVGVNVPNASIMIIENAEKFGLSQLHQLRGRVGRGAEQSFCILMTGYKISKEGKIRLATMERTNNGFEIADIDLKLRGPGDLSGTQQSGVLNLLVADIAQDGKILQEARHDAQQIIADDPNLSAPEHQPIRHHIDSLRKDATNWSRIS